MSCCSGLTSKLKRPDRVTGQGVDISLRQHLGWREGFFDKRQHRVGI